MEFRFLPFLTKNRSRGISPHIGMENIQQKGKVWGTFAKYVLCTTLIDTFCKLKQEALNAGLIVNNNKTK